MNEMRWMGNVGSILHYIKASFIEQIEAESEFGGRNEWDL